MDLVRFVEDLSSASLFDLARLELAIRQLQNDPAKIEEARRRLKSGMNVSYLDTSSGGMVQAQVRQLKRTRVLVQNTDDGKLWNIHYSSVNLDGVPPAPLLCRTNSMRDQWQVGDMVAFQDRQNQEVYGRITRLNSKTATVLAKDDRQWRVGYSYLVPVWEGQAQEPPLRIVGAEESESLPLISNQSAKE